MTRGELLAELERILSSAHTAVLATVDTDGNPHMRWMTPALIRGRPGVVFAVTSPRFAKANQIRSNPVVEWMFQPATLKTIISVRGRINLLDNPSIRTEVLEVLGPRLRTFWKVNPDVQDLLVLETVIEKASCFFPLSGEREVVKGWQP